MTEYVVKENSSSLPVINELTAWHQQYYLDKFSSRAHVLTGQKEFLVDSILQASKKGNKLKGFWIVGAHGDALLNDSVRKSLDTSYVLVKERKFYDAWAQLYILKSYSDSSYTIISYKDFKNGEGALLADQKQIAIWDGAIHSKPLFLKAGKYKMTISATGTKAGNEYPHLNIYINGKKIGDYFISANMEEKDFEFENSSDGNIVFTIEMDNDLFLPASKEDRNVFLSSIVLKQNN